MRTNKFGTILLVLISFVFIREYSFTLNFGKNSQDRYDFYLFRKEEKLFKDNLTFFENDTFIRFPILEPKLTCDPCVNVQCQLPNFSSFSSLCKYERVANYSSEKLKSSQYKFAFVTMLEPSWKNNQKSLHNLITLLHSIDRYYQYKSKHFILVDSTTDIEMLLLQRTTYRKLIFVDVKEAFAPTRERQKLFQEKRTSCLGDYSYRSMCRFASGPIYWIDVLKGYEYIIRIDEDAKFTKTIPTDLISDLVNINGAYGYLLEQTSSSQCRIGMDELIIRFLNEVDHNKLGRPWIRLGDFKFFHGINRNGNLRDTVNFSKIVGKTPLITAADRSRGSLKWDTSKLTSVTYFVGKIETV